MKIPAQFSQRVRATYGAAGAEWLRTLPVRVAEYADRWALALRPGALAGASLSYLRPAVRADGAPVVLKLSPPNPWIAHEEAALTHWRGRGAVRLEAADPVGGALLLERAMPGTPLAAFCESNDGAATAAAAAVIRQLQEHRSPPSPGTELPHLSDWIAKLGDAQAAGVPPALRAAGREALALAEELLQEDTEPILLHGDLHQMNLVAAERAPWLAVDPKGLWGPPEAETAALLRNPRSWLLGRRDREAIVRHRIQRLSDELGFEVRRLEAWGYTLAVLAAWWAFEDGGRSEIVRWLACAESLAPARS